MDFFDQEAHAKRRTHLLLCLFGLAVFAFIVLTYLILALPIRLFRRHWRPAQVFSSGFGSRASPSGS